MAEKKISELVGLTSVSGGAILPIVAGDTTYKVDVEELTGYTQQLIRANITGSNTFTATQNFDGAVFLNGDVTFGGDLTATPITKLNEFTSSVDTNLYSKVLLSSSVQISSEISGSFTQLSESLASRIDGIPAAQPGIVSSSVQIVEYGFTQTSSFNSYTSSLNQSTESVIRNEQTSSFALTGSENIFYANQTITGSLGVGNIYLNSSSIYLNSNEVLYRNSMGGNSNLYLHSYDSDGLILAVDSKQWQLTTDGNIVTSDGGSDIENSNGLKVFNSLNLINTQTGSQDSVNLGISIVTGSLNEQTASQDGVNFGISVVTSSIDAHILGISTYTSSLFISSSASGSVLKLHKQDSTIQQMKIPRGLGYSGLGWARYDDTTYTTSSTFTIADGVDTRVPCNASSSIETHMHSSVPFFNPVSQRIQAENEGDVYSVTLDFNMKAATNPSDGDYVRLSMNNTVGTPYTRVGRDLYFSKNDTNWHSFHEIFQYYSDSDFVTNGNEFNLIPNGVGIEIADVIIFIQRTQNHSQDLDI